MTPDIFHLGKLHGAICIEPNEGPLMWSLMLLKLYSFADANDYFYTNLKLKDTFISWHATGGNAFEKFLKYEL